MAEDGITYLLWHDLVGITRTRGVPTKSLKKRGEHGLGWACAGQAITVFSDIVDNPWGPMDEVRQIPDLATRFTIPGDENHQPLDAVICNSMINPSTPWDCCGRSFLQSALTALQRETGFQVYASFEHEFTLGGPDFVPETPFSLAAARVQNDFLLDLNRALTAVGVIPFTLEPEFGDGQYEIACEPAFGLAAADQCLISREVIREIGRRHGLEVSFSPKPSPETAGNGAHLHLSLCDQSGQNLTFDPNGPAQLSEKAAQFCAGVLQYMDALVAITCPAPVSYFRLGPHHWSCGYRAIGLQNREAALRITPGIGDESAKRQGHNIEYRASDGAASPYLVLGAIIYAGLEGIRNAIPLMEPIDRDPAELTEKERTSMGITELPTSLSLALDEFCSDSVAQSWFSTNMAELYLRLKRWEVSYADDTDDEVLFEKYRQAY